MEYNQAIKRLKRIENRHKKENKINTYLEVFYNSRYDMHKLFFDNLDTFFYLICTFIDEVREFIIKYPYPSLQWSKVTKMGFLDKEKLIDAFFKKINIPLKLEDIIRDGTFNVTVTDYIDAIEKDDASLESGSNTLSDDKIHDIIEVYDNNLVTDVITWVHEISHHLNFDIKNKSMVRALFTESLSFAYEFIFLDFLDEQEFSYEAEKFKFKEFRSLFYNLCNVYPIIKLYILFDKLGSVSKENYRLYFEYDHDYDEALDSLINVIEKGEYNLIYTQLEYALAYALSIYMYIEYTKDNSFIDKMKCFNKAIKCKGVRECLSIIEINDISEKEVDKIKNSFRLMKLELLNGFDRSVARSAYVDAFLEEFTKLFNEKTMLYQNLDELLFLINFLRYNISGFIGFIIPEVDISKLSKASNEEKYGLIRLFYKYIGKDINLESIRKINTIKEVDVDEVMKENDPTFFVRSSLRGTSYYDEDVCEKASIVYNTGYVLDSFAWVHEFSHISNQPNKTRNEVSFLLTESISFTEELIYGDFLSSIGYSYEAAFCKYDFLSNIDVFIEDTYPIIKMLKIYIKYGKITKLNYSKDFNSDDDYEDILSESLTMLKDDPQDILSGIRYTVASALSIYMYIEYKKDKSFMKKINDFSAAINSEDLFTCLNIIGINGLDEESLNKLRLAINEFKNELNKLSESNIINLYDMEKGISF